MREAVRLVTRILVKRRRLCISHQRHTIGHCTACGVHR